jgi:hypothetical protein
VPWPKFGLGRPTCQADRPLNLAMQPSFGAALPFSHGYPSCRLKFTCVEDRFQKDAKPGRPAKGVWPTGPTLARQGPAFVPRYPLVSYCE